MKQKPWQECANILCVRLDNMGDIIMTIPALQAIKEQNSKRKITLLTSPIGSDIAKYIPVIDNTITFSAVWIKNENKQMQSGKVLEIIRKIKKHDFDAAIIFTTYSQNPLPAALLCFLADIPKRMAYSRENPYQLLTDWVADTEPFTTIKHEVQRQIDLVATIGAMPKEKKLSLRILQEEQKTVSEKLKKLSIDAQKPFLIIHPGVSEKKRQYSPELFAKAAHLLIKDFHYQIIFTGTESEKNLVNIIMKKMDNIAHSLAGKLTIGELIGLISLSDTFIANNTGPVHVAAAVGTPVVSLYARTNPQHTPWMVKNKILYFDVPENKKSKNQILAYTQVPQKKPMPTPIDIVAAVNELLNNKKNTYTNKDILTY